MLGRPRSPATADVLLKYRAGRVSGSARGQWGRPPRLSAERADSGAGLRAFYEAGLVKQGGMGSVFYSGLNGPWDCGSAGRPI